MTDHEGDHERDADATLDRELTGSGELTPDDQRELAEREAAGQGEVSRERN
ncbi:hypothetical protein ACWEOE_26555 [Amycolatopsis sp. NPDC004368]